MAHSLAMLRTGSTERKGNTRIKTSGFKTHNLIENFMENRVLYGLPKLSNPAALMASKLGKKRPPFDTGS